MLVLETVAKIRRAYFVQKKSIKAICRELSVSRKVVRKVLRSEATEFRKRHPNSTFPGAVSTARVASGMVVDGSEHERGVVRGS